MVVGHKDRAWAQYVELSRQHRLFKCHPAGLNVNPDHPHLGATPDGTVSRTWCGDGLQCDTLITIHIK